MSEPKRRTKPGTKANPWVWVGRGSRFGPPRAHAHGCSYVNEYSSHTRIGREEAKDKGIGPCKVCQPWKPLPDRGPAYP